MGYYTNYTLEKATKVQTEYLKQESGYTWEDWAGESYLNAKWYDWEADLVKVSAVFPDDLIILYGDGDETDDFWKAYALGGKVEITHPEMVWPPNPFEETPNV